eukprot:2593546-Amphidinium_carterae.1
MYAFVALCADGAGFKMGIAFRNHSSQAAADLHCNTNDLQCTRILSHHTFVEGRKTQNANLITFCFSGCCCDNFRCSANMSLAFSQELGETKADKFEASECMAQQSSDLSVASSDLKKAARTLSNQQARAEPPQRSLNAASIGISATRFYSNLFW